MKTLDQWFAEYGQSHQHESNKTLHWIGIPLIMFSLLGLLSYLPLGVVPWTPVMNVASAFILLALLFYFQLSWRLALGMAVVSALMVGGHIALRHNSRVPLWQICLVLFVLGWVAQFAGHKVEGRKPSFFKDLQFLLIGPLWLLADLYRRAGLRR